MAKRSAKKNYVEDMDRDFNNAKFAHELTVKKGWEAEPLTETAGQIVLDAIAYSINGLVDNLNQHVKGSTNEEWGEAAYDRLNSPWLDLVQPAYENGFEETSKSKLALEALNLVSRFSDEELEIIEEQGKTELMDLTVSCFDPIREFYERNAV